MRSRREHLQGIYLRRIFNTTDKTSIRGSQYTIISWTTKHNSLSTRLSLISSSLPWTSQRLAFLYLVRLRLRCLLKHSLILFIFEKSEQYFLLFTNYSLGVVITNCNSALIFDLNKTLLPPLP